MTRYRLAIFDFDGTLADSLPWFRASFQDMIRRFDLAPVRDDEVEGLRGLSAREIMARLNVSMWQLPAIVSDMRKRKLAAASEISLFKGIPAGARTYRQSDHSLRLRSCHIRQALEISAGRTTVGNGASRYDLHWRRDPRHRGGRSRRHGFRRGGLGLRTSERAAGGGTDASVQFDRGDDAAAHYDEIIRRRMSAG